MQTELATTQPRLPSVPSDVSVGALEAAVGMGDFSRLASGDRMRYLAALCDSLKLNIYSRPFEIINIGGKIVLYATKGCAEQLRQIHGVSITVIQREHANGCYVVSVKATDANGRVDEATGAVPCPDQAAPDIRCNAIMKAETKAKRRVTLSICGLGILDESELDTIRKERITAAVNGETASDAAEALNAELVDEPTKAVEPRATVARKVEAEVFHKTPEPGREHAGKDGTASNAQGAGGSPDSPAPTRAGFPQEPAPAPIPQESPSGTPAVNPPEPATAATTSAGLDFKLQSELETAIGPDDGLKALKWMRKEGWLKADEGFERLKPTQASRVLKNLESFRVSIAKV